MTPRELRLTVAGFRTFDACPMGDGTIYFSGTVKLDRSTYFASIKVTRRENGTPSLALGDYRFETFTGKAVSGKANVKLEDMMVSAKEAALAWAASHYQAAGSMGQ